MLDAREKKRKHAKRTKNRICLHIIFKYKSSLIQHDRKTSGTVQLQSRRVMGLRTTFTETAGSLRAKRSNVGLTTLTA